MSRPSTTLPSGERPSQTPRRTRLTGSQGPVPGRRLRTAALVASFLTLPILLSGCSTEWASMSPSLSVKKPNLESVASTTSAPTPTSTSTAASQKPTGLSTTHPANPFAGGELANGSVQHTQAVGDHSLVINYWTDGSDSDVHLSAMLKGADTKHTVKVTQFAASLVEGVEGKNNTGVSLADDRGEFVLTPPYSYTSALALPVLTDTTLTTDTQSWQIALARTIDVRFDLLIETAPGSGAFYRQTVLDTVALNASSSNSGSSSSEATSVSEGDTK